MNYGRNKYDQGGYCPPAGSYSYPPQGGYYPPQSAYPSQGGYYSSQQYPPNAVGGYPPSGYPHHQPSYHAPHGYPSGTLDHPNLLSVINISATRVLLVLASASSFIYIFHFPF